MKPFEDFISTLTENELAQIADKVNEKRKHIEEKTSNDLGMQVSSFKAFFFFFPTLSTSLMLPVTVSGCP
ncbi:MAG: hypothetical protein NC548_31380 [Lachnospiraceae bacterium]|nr:hypothetical protein [Bacteroides fragilis]MCM1219007.1 hypothetical protein [Lachnospiraceae bacterium]